MVKLTENLALARSRGTDLDNVRKLNCWASGLTDVRILRKLQNIQIVSLSVNKISTLEDFGYCQNLEELYIRKNNISNLAEICFLKKLPKLRVLWLADNPCAVGDIYRMTVLKNLPNLQKLDNIVVTEEEVNDAIEKGIELTQEGDTEESASVSSSRVLPDRESSSTPSHTNNSTEQGTSPGSSDEKGSEDCKETESPNALSVEETNKIRAQLGMKPLPLAKLTPPVRHSHSAKSRNANILQAALHLIKELDSDSLEIVQDAVRNRLETM